MRLLLTIQSGTLTGQRFELTDGFITIGRSENSDIKFDPRNEKIASKQHAYIEARPEGFYLSDSQSTNGTLVNGQKIQTVKLNNGDVIQFGVNGIKANVAIDMQSSVVEKFGQPVQSLPSSNYEDNQTPPFPKSGNPSVHFRNSISRIGLGNPQAEPTKNRTGQYLGIGVTIFALVFLSLIVTGIMFLSLGPIAAVIAAVIAFVPAIFYLMPLVWLDRFDPEPIWILALAFAWGALVAVFISFIINTFVGAILGPEVGAVISAPIFEEGSKGLGLLLLLLFFRRYFDGILDGLIFAGVIALGFATVENVLYYGRGLLGGGVSGLAILFFIRGILSPFAHVTFTSMTGIGCGISRESHNPFVRITTPILGYGCAIFLHALWNGIAVVAGLGGFILIYILLEIPFFLIFVGFTFYIMRRQNKILREMLTIDVARGMIPPEHLDVATSSFKSFSWVWGGAMQGKYNQRRKYLRAIGKLGLSYWHIQRATAAHGQTGSFQQNPILREEVLKWRDQV